jgi:hypothetical protein
MNVKTLSLVAALIASFGSTAALAADEYTLNQNLPAATASVAPRVAVRVAATDEYQRNQFAAAVVPSGLQRAQVVAEAIEARKLGLITEGERQAPAPTAVQAEQIRLAGLNAVNHQVAAK